MSNSDKIPRRDLNSESAKILQDIIQVSLQDMLQTTCPCHYPRFRHLVQFKHTDYHAEAVFCADVNFLIFESCAKKTGFLELTGRITDHPLGDYEADLVYTCSKCATVYKMIGIQYNMNFEFVYFIIMDAKYGEDAGAAAEFPIPLYQGLFGFKEEDMLKCAVDFRLGTSEELHQYLVQKQTD